MTTLDWMFININIAAIIGMLCWVWGFCCGDRFSTDYFNWSNGWDCCREAIKEGLSEEGKTLVDKYTGKDEENEDC